MHCTKSKFTGEGSADVQGNAISARKGSSALKEAITSERGPAII